MTEQIRYAFYLPEERVIHVSEAKRGSCDCICLECEAELESCKGDIIPPYFRHVNKDSSCKGGQETAIHKFAKQIILENRDIEIHTGRISYSEAKEEEKIGVFFADAVLILPSVEKIYIEVKVTHGVDKLKRVYFQSQGIKCVEIDLSNIPYDISPEDLKELVLNNKDNRKRISWTEDKYNEIIGNIVFWGITILAIVCVFRYLAKPKRYKRRKRRRNR